MNPPNFQDSFKPRTHRSRSSSRSVAVAVTIAAAIAVAEIVVRAEHRSGSTAVIIIVVLLAVEICSQKSGSKGPVHKSEANWNEEFFWESISLT